MKGYKLLRSPNSAQYPEQLSFVGGQPILPVDTKMPKCKLCDAQQTFFFQIAFPTDHNWAGKVMAAFFCTKCADIDYVSPSATGPDDFKHLPDNFLQEHSVNYKFLVFEASQPLRLKNTYIALLEYEQISFKKLAQPRSRSTKVGGEPYWYLEDDTPISYMGSGFTFLMQLSEDWPLFKKLEDAPEQADVKLFISDSGFRNDGLYQFFGGAPLYFFGTLDLPEPKVYLLNQK
jgi:hypothetical protein